MADTDVWINSHNQYKLHGEAVRDLHAFERRTEENFRTAERVAFDNTGRLADRLAASELNLVCALKDMRGDVLVNIERVHCAVKEAEYRTGERITHDGDRTRELINRLEEATLRERLNVLEVAEHVRRDRGRREDEQNVVVINNNEVDRIRRERRDEDNRQVML